MKNLLMLTAVLATLIASVSVSLGAAASASYRSPADVVGTGGGRSSSESYSQNATVGEAFVGNFTGGSVGIQAGFQPVSVGKDFVTITGNVTLTADDLTYENLSIAVRADATLTVAGTHSFADLTVAGTVTHGVGDTKGVNLLIGDTLDVLPDGTINVSGRGYRGGGSDGNANGTGETKGENGLATVTGGARTDSSFGVPSGGSYGSLGGGPLPNALYGSEITPVDLGSGGSGSTQNPGGNGGGRMEIRAGSIVVNGQLLADGGGANTAGGGSGGSIYLTLAGGTFAGNGTIRAARGISMAAPRSGGLGRIAIIGFGDKSFSGTIGPAATQLVQPAGGGGDLRLDNTTVTIPAGQTRTLGTLTWNGSTPSTVYNQGTLILKSDSLTVPNLAIFVQNGVLKGGTRPDNVIGDITVASGGVITHDVGTLTGVQLKVAGKLEVQSGGAIDVTARGYRGGGSDGNVSSTGETKGENGVATITGGARTDSSFGVPSGGSYGSLGGGPLPNALYGSETAPVDLGSGGSGNQGGNGGGRMEIDAGSMVINGQLLADGGGANNQGGGSGGSIYLKLTGTLAGNGVIRAAGGISTASTRSGGLGRIAITGFSANNFAGTLGQAGTVFLQPAGGVGDLRLDNTTLTILAGQTRTFGTLTWNGSTPSTVYNRGTLILSSDSLTVPNLATLVQNGVVKGGNRPDDVIGNITVASGGVITHDVGWPAGVQLKVAGKLEVQSGGAIDVTARGYRGGGSDGNVNGTGETKGENGVATIEGGARTEGRFGTAAGGSYGSLGGGQLPNALYGTETAPVDLGSGGSGEPSGRHGGNGGGRMQIEAANIVVDGQLLADGGSADVSGGGSGGSIYLKLTGTLAGNGVIRTGGGGSTAPTRGGGLGRIAITGFSANNFTGTLGRAGTVFLQSADTHGDLWLDSTTFSIGSAQLRQYDILINDASILTNQGTLTIGTLNWKSSAPSTINNQGTLLMGADSLTVPNLAMLVQNGVLKGGARPDDVIGNITVASGGLITHDVGSPAGVQLKVAGKLEVQSGGAIDVTANGYRGGISDGNVSGTGETKGENGVATITGGARTDGSFGSSSGGSYGSLGGGLLPNALYGTESAPVDLGSGGSSASGHPGGNGGGRIEIEAANIVVDGQLLADGGGADVSGGGSGGSIYLKLALGKLSGNGVIRAAGGISTASTRSGGGGRMAITGFSQNAFTGQLGPSGTTYIPAAVNPLADDDGDGVSNADELIAGTDRNSAQDVLKLAPAAVTQGNIQFHFPTKPGKHYRIESRADFRTGTWQTYSTGVIGDGGYADFSLIPLPNSKMFFRIVVEP